MIWNTYENVCITPQPCHSHFCCWLLPIWTYLDVSAENGANGLSRLGWRYNGANIYFSWPYMIVSMIWNTSENFALRLSRAKAIFVVDCCQFAQAGLLGWKWSLWPVPACLVVQRRKAVFFLTLYDSINDMKHFLNVCITPHLCHSHVCCWLLPMWP